MRIKLKLQEVNNKFNFAIVEDRLSINFKFDKAFMPEPYTGNYNVIPTFDVQKLFTKNKSMRDDVTIQSIPLSEVTNPQNGITVTIGV